MRPSPEHFRQYSEMTSPSPPQVGHTETLVNSRKKLSEMTSPSPLQVGPWTYRKLTLKKENYENCT